MKEIKKFIFAIIVYLSGFVWLTLILSRYMTGGAADFSSFLSVNGLNSLYLFSMLLTLGGVVMLLVSTFPSIIAFVNKHYGTSSQAQAKDTATEDQSL